METFVLDGEGHLEMIETEIIPELPVVYGDRSDRI